MSFDVSSSDLFHYKPACNFRLLLSYVLILVGWLLEYNSNVPWAIFDHLPFFRQLGTSIFDE